MDFIDTIVSWLEAHKTGVGVFSTLIASLSACISAANAWFTKRAANYSARQNEISLVAIEAKAIQTEFERIKRLGIDLQRAYLTLATFTGNVGSSRSEMSKRAVDEKVSRGTAISKQATETLQDLEAIQKHKTTTVVKLKADFSMALIELRGLSESMITELSDVSSQSLPYREKAAR